MTDLKDQLARLLDDEPAAPDDIDRVVRSGRRARGRRNAVLSAAGTLGVMGAAAAVVVPMMVTGGNGTSVSVAVRPSPAPTANATKCYFISTTSKTARLTVARLIHSGKLGPESSIKTVRVLKGTKNRTLVEVCAQGTSSTPVNKEQPAQAPAGPPYVYTESPAAISSRLGAHLHSRVTGLGLSINYTRPFSQESSTLEHGQPSYFGGNVDVHETSGYADI